MLRRGIVVLLLGCYEGTPEGAEPVVCDPAIAHLVSAQGQVDALRAHRTIWQPAPLNSPYCVEDTVRTGNLSRAVLAMLEGIATYISLNQNTLVRFLSQADRVFLSIDHGQTHVRSHTPRRFDVTTPFINAGIEGTEFFVSAGADEAEITVFEGKVKVSNAKGSLSITKGQTAFAKSGQAPQIKLLVKPDDAVQWVLYYPPIIDANTLNRTTPSPFLRRALKHYLSGRIPDALLTLDQAPDAERETSDYLAVKAGLLLTVGRVDEAEPLINQALRQLPDNAMAHALQAVIALARNNREQALALARKAVALAPQSPVPLLALSYAEQARFQLDDALKAVDAALKLDPENGLAYARQAELLASLGEHSKARRAAEKSVRLNPQLGRAQTVLGFTQLMEFDTDEAAQSFRNAIGQDSFDPLAHFGLGLTKIRKGKLEEGTEDIEIAGSLDPNDSLTRSYLGKAYYEQKRNPIAQVQFDLAKQFDPKDPTPYFYEAIKKQMENRPIEALHDLQKAIELNDNRAVFRSRLKLDNDLAVRSAALGRIYGDLGFSQRALVESWRAISDDPTDYSSHRLLSDSYSALPRHDLARASELLQSQLFQPINLTPVQPRLADGDVFLVGNIGPSGSSINEFNPIFDRNRIGLLASGLVGNNTYSNELVNSGVWNSYSYSLGQFHYDNAGFRPNSAVDANIYNAFLQGQLAPWLNVQAEYRHRDVNRGNLVSRFFSSENDTDIHRWETDNDTFRLGAHLTPTNGTDILFSFFHNEERYTVIRTLPTARRPLSSYRGNSGELLYIDKSQYSKTLVGGRFSQVSLNEEGFREQHWHGYLYEYLKFPSSVKWTVGFSLDFLDDAENVKTKRDIEPKLGVVWDITQCTTFRASFFQNRKGYLFSSQTVEPTQVAGFNQIYDDWNETKSRRWGVGIDHRFTELIQGGVEISERALKVPGEDVTDKWRESVLRSYLLWTPHPRWAGTLEYFREEFDNLTSETPHSVRTSLAPVAIAYFDPSGWFTRLKFTYFRQELLGKSDETPFLDLSIGYRLPNRLGLVELQLQNLLNKNYRYEGWDLRAPQPSATGIPPFLPFVPEFSPFLRVTFAL